MSTENKSGRWIWILLLLGWGLWWWWSRKPAAAASSPGPAPQSQPERPPQAVVDTFEPPPSVEAPPVTGSSLTTYATFNPDSYAPETRAALNTVREAVYDDAGRIVGKIGLYEAYERARDAGQDVTAIVAQMESAILVLFPNSALLR